MHLPLILSLREETKIRVWCPSEFPATRQIKAKGSQVQGHQCHPGKNEKYSKDLVKKNHRPIFLRPCIPGWPQTPYVVGGAPELLILFPLPSECWGFRLEPPHLVYVVLRIKCRVLCVPSKHLTNRVTAPVGILASCKSTCSLNKADSSFTVNRMPLFCNRVIMLRYEDTGN